MISNLLLRLTSTYPYTRCIIVVTSCIISCTVVAVRFVIRVVEAIVVRRKTVQKVKKYLQEILKKLVISRNLEKSNEILIVRLTEPGSAISPTVVSNVIKA